MEGIDNTLFDVKRQHQDLQAAKLAAEAAEADKEVAKTRLTELLTRAATEVRDYLVENSVETDVKVFTPEKRGLFGRVKTPPNLVLEGWTVTSYSEGEKGNLSTNVKDRDVPLVQTSRTVLSTDGRFYEWVHIKPLDDVSAAFEPYNHVWLLDIHNTSDNDRIADGMARLISGTEIIPSFSPYF